MSARLRRLVGRGVQYYRSHGLLATIHKVAGFPGYGVWRRIYAAPAPAQRRAMRACGQRLSRQPVISVVMPVYQTPERFLRCAIQSVREQIYPNWQLCIVDDASPDAAIGRLLAEAAAADSRIRLGRLDRNGGIAAASNAALAMAGGDYVAFLDHDDALAPDALLAVAMEINAHPDAKLIYSDEDKLDPAGRHRDPYFKPDWNADLLLGQNYLNHLLVVRRSRLDEVGGFRLDFEGSQDHDLVLRLAEGIEPAHIRHIPRVLYHWRMVPTSFSTARLSSATAAAGRAVAEHLARQGIVAEVEPDPATGRYLRVRRPLPEPPPRVTLVVPTHDKVCSVAPMHRRAAGWDRLSRPGDHRGRPR